VTNRGRNDDYRLIFGVYTQTQNTHTHTRLRLDFCGVLPQRCGTVTTCQWMLPWCHTDRTRQAGLRFAVIARHTPPHFYLRPAWF